MMVPAYAPPGDSILQANVDHLYAECPLLRRLCRGKAPRRLGGLRRLFQGEELVDEYVEADGVDPEGTDICGLCRRWYRARNREVAAATGGEI